MHFIPRRFLGRRIILAVAVFALALLYFLSDFSVSDLALFHASIAQDPPGTWRNHPVVVLHERAQRDFDALLQRQSKTAEEAEARYRARYGKPPPPGFLRWVEYALRHKSPIIDDFDTVSNGAHRFFNLTAAEVVERMREATAPRPDEEHNDGIAKCSFANGRFNDGCRKFAEPLTALLGEAGQLAPEVDFLINFLDEPSVLPEQPMSRDSLVAPWKNGARTSIADTLADVCKPRSSPISGREPREPVETYGLPFVQDVAASKDLCRHPEYRSGHGFVMCPASFMQMRRAVPILSQAAPRPFADILYPSTHYGLKSSLYSQIQDRPWSWKKNAVYWTGASTGGYWSQDTWRHGHRQRLAALGMGKEQRGFIYLKGSTTAESGIKASESLFFDSSRFDIALTKIVGCADENVCAEQNRFFDMPRPIDPESRPFKYRYGIDIDGNSYSGRFYRLLASASVPLKVSIFREWHDERLVPWLHYVPVSQSMDELPELMRFLATTREGQRISRRIAEAGRDWYFKAVTPVHQGIYLYRLMLELAWMQDPSRPRG